MACQMLRGLSESLGNSEIPKFWNFGISERIGSAGRERACRILLRFPNLPISRRMLPCLSERRGNSEIPQFWDSGVP